MKDFKEIAAPYKSLKYIEAIDIDIFFIVLKIPTYIFLHPINTN